MPIRRHIALWICLALAALSAPQSALAAPVMFSVQVVNGHGALLQDMRVGIDGASTWTYTDATGTAGMVAESGQPVRLRLYTARSCAGTLYNTGASGADQVVTVTGSLTAGSVFVLNLNQVQAAQDAAAWQRAVVDGQMTLIERQLVKEINDYRVSQGLGALAAHRRFNHLAVRHAAYMSATGSMSHCGDGGLMPHMRARYEAIKGSMGAEALGMSDSAADMVRGWVASESHRAILLASNATGIGVGQAGGYFALDVYSSPCAATETDANVCTVADSTLAPGEADTVNPVVQRTATSIRLGATAAYTLRCGTRWCMRLGSVAYLLGAPSSRSFAMTLSRRSASGRYQKVVTARTTSGRVGRAQTWTLPLSCNTKLRANACMKARLTYIRWSFAGTADYLPSARVKRLFF